MTSSDESAAAPDYGELFAELFRQNIPRVPGHVAKRVKNGDTIGAPSRRDRKVAFIESDLRKYLDTREWPLLKIEEGRIDYVFTIEIGKPGCKVRIKRSSKAKPIERPTYQMVS